MENSSPPDYQALYLRAEEERQREAELRKQAEQERDQGREQTRQTTFAELIRFCHVYFSRSLRAESPSRSTTGKIPAPTGKRCPLQLLHWTNCAAEQQKVYRSVCAYLAPSNQPAARLFSPRLALKDLGQRFSKRAISSEQDLESYERFGVEDYVRDIITELCKIPTAREEFRLGDAIQFDNHANALDAVDADQSQTDKPSSSRRSRPDQYCIHRVDGNSSTIIMTVEYKPPHKLSVENLRAGLRPMQFWEEVIRPDSVPTEGPEKLRYNAAWLTGSAVVQEYHVMLQEGLEYSYLTNGFAIVLLRVPYDDPGTLYYHLCEPNMEVYADDELSSLQQPLTAVARILCLCLMSFRSQYRDQEWRNATKKLPEWKTSFDHTRSQIPESELQQIPPDSEYTASEYTSSEPTTSEYIPSSSPAPSPADGRRIPTRSRASCASPNLTPRDDSDSDADQAPGGIKRGFSQVTSSPSSPSVQRSARLAGPQDTPSSSQGQQHTARFCAQKCLRSLQRGGQLDDNCPNVMLHRRGGNSSQHPIDAETLIKQLKQQLDENIDRDCTPLGGCGASGVPFKVTYTAYGYTMVGKGTTSRRWDEVKREEDAGEVTREASV
ncbi:similar to An08g12110 [Aspergillus luchuensis IFO 4308]|nr:similar to An08g12110 [Aspergillus luchuensis IFO 4308]